MNIFKDILNIIRIEKGARQFIKVMNTEAGQETNKKVRKMLGTDYSEFDNLIKSNNGTPFYASKKPIPVRVFLNKGKAFEIHTLEGVMLAKRGDYIIEGIEGEVYPCKPEIFKKTYEEVGA